MIDSHLPRMTGKMKKDVMRFEQLREQFRFLRENGIESEAQKADCYKKPADFNREIRQIRKQNREI